jgi:two-component system sensor histidine kinase KdpD
LDLGGNERSPPDAAFAPEQGAWRSRAALGRDFVGIAAVSAVTALGLWLGGRKDLTNTAIAYLFIIALISMRLGYRSTLLAALASALCFDYFFLPPYGSFNIDNGRDLVTEVAMCGVAVFVSTLNERLRKQALTARLGEQRTESLYGLVKALANARSLDALSVAGLRQIESAVAVSARILLRKGGEQFESAYSSTGRVALEVADLAAAGWAADHREPAGLGTRNLSNARACYIPLVVARGCIGVLAVRPRQGVANLAIGPSSLIGSMALQVAMAIESTMLAEEKRRAEVEAETERIRNAVLSSISHDLRSPLHVITSASSTLVEQKDRLPAPARAEMSRLINEEAKRLSELLKSLLDVTRLQAGKLEVNRDWESLEEVVASVLRRLEQRTGLVEWRLRAHVDQELPPLEIDAVLIEQVLMNLIANALAYAGGELPIHIKICARDENTVLISVSDHGKGIPSDELARIFDKFYRSRGSAGPGLGLGLTLARGIVEAHGGRIWATPTPGGGLTVEFTLPITSATPTATEEVLSEGARAWSR